MRLTLRTMLAYLDDVLDPADAQELGARISESEFASELVHRVRSSARKMRLSAPELEEQGVGAEFPIAKERASSLGSPSKSKFQSAPK